MIGASLDILALQIYIYIYVVYTALATLSFTLGVQLNMRLSKSVLDTTPLLTRMCLQLYACEPYSSNYTVVEPHADNLELLYLLGTNTQV